MPTKRDHVQMEKRRVRAAALFEKNISAPEVGRRLGVTRQVAYRWKEAWAKGGKAGLASKGKAGRKSKLTADQTEQVIVALVAMALMIVGVTVTVVVGKGIGRERAIFAHRACSPRNRRGCASSNEANRIRLDRNLARV